MTFSMDLDGTFLKYPMTFRHTAEMLQRSGHKVGILSNRSSAEKVTVGFKPDFEIYLDVRTEDRISQKLNAMDREGIDFHFDDEDFLGDPRVITIK